MLSYTSQLCDRSQKCYHQNLLRYIPALYHQVLPLRDVLFQLRYFLIMLNYVSIVIQISMRYHSSQFCYIADALRYTVTKTWKQVHRLSAESVYNLLIISTNKNQVMFPIMLYLSSKCKLNRKAQRALDIKWKSRWIKSPETRTVFILPWNLFNLVIFYP